MKVPTMLTEIAKLPTLQIGNVLLSLDLDEPTENTKQIAELELRETKEIKEKSIQELRQLLQDEKDLTLPLDNVNWLIRFLRPCKFYPESAKELIKRYYAFKIKHKDIYETLLPIHEENIFKSNVITVFHNRDQLGRRVLVLSLGKNWKHKEVCLDEVFKGCVLFLEIALLEHETQINGSVVIFDMDGLSLAQTWQFTPSFAKRIVDWLQDSVPIRLKAIHIVNQPKIFNVVFALFKPFLREKLRSRIHFHGTDRESLQQHIAPKYLPTEYGGISDALKISGSQWYEILKKCNDEFIAINSFGYQKSK